MILCKRSNSKDCERKQNHNAAATKKASHTLTRADSRNNRRTSGDELARKTII